MRASVVIPTYRRGELLGRALEALARQTLDRSRFEVLVVDDGSPEPPERVVAGYRERLPVRLLLKPNGGLASTRNHGARHAAGDVLVFMDDDIRPCPDFVAEHLALHEARDRVVGLGSLPHPSDLEETPFHYYLNRIVHYDLFVRFGSADAIPLPPLNGNSSIRRAAFEAAGGYDTSFARYGGEDTEMGYRLRRSGFTFVYLPRARGEHFHVKGYPDYRRDMRSSGAAIVAIVRKYPEVLARVNLDLVTARLSDLPPAKRLRQLALDALERTPALVGAMEALLGCAPALGWKRPFYPLYLLAAHAHYAAGMRAELVRGAPPAVRA